jgi:hypothetical protein
MADNETVVFSPPIEATVHVGQLTMFGVMLHVQHLFEEIAKCHGQENARKLFKDIGSASKDRLRIWRNWQVLDRLDRMEPRVPHKLARELAKENETLPPADRWGPRGSTKPEVQCRHIYRLIDQRDKGLKDGTWCGPGAGWDSLVRVRAG